MPRLRSIDEIKKQPRLRPIEEIAGPGTDPDVGGILDKAMGFFSGGDTPQSLKPPTKPPDIRDLYFAGDTTPKALTMPTAGPRSQDPNYPNPMESTPAKVVRDVGHFVMGIPDLVTKVIPQTALHASTSGPRLLRNLGVDLPVKLKPTSEVTPYSLGSPDVKRMLGEWFSGYLFDVPFWENDPLQKHLKEPSINKLKELGLIGEGFNASTFEKNWEEQPGGVILDVAAIAYEGLRIPTIAASKIGTKLSKIRVAGEIAKAKPGAADDFITLVNKGFTVDEAIGIMAEHYAPAVGKAAQKGGKALKGTMPEKMMKFGSRERAPLKVGGQEIERKYSPNVAYRGIQEGLTLARKKIPGIEKILSGAENFLGIHPAQRAWDMVFRSVDARAQRVVENEYKAVRKALGKLSKEERAEFVKALEGTTEAPGGGLYPKPYDVEVSPEFAHAMDEYDKFVNKLNQTYEDIGLKLPETDAPHTERARIKYIEKKITEGMDEADAVKAWDDLRQEPEAVIAERQKDVKEWYGKDEPPPKVEPETGPGPKPPVKPKIKPETPDSAEISPKAEVAGLKPVAKEPIPSEPGLHSPFGHVSERAKKAHLERSRKELFGEKGLEGPKAPPPLSEAERLLQQADELDTLAKSGMKPRAYKKKAAELREQAKTKLPGKPSTKPLKPPVKNAGVELTASKQVSFQGKEAPLWARRVSVDDILTDPERFQFKLKVDPKSGESIAMKGAQKWKEYAADRIFIWEDDAGKLWVADGHHRLALAKRLGVKDIDAYVFRASDGITAEEARTIGALNNLMKGTGTAADAAKFLRDTGMSAEQLAKEGVSASSTLIDHGVALSKLSDDVFRMVINEDITIPQGAAIGRELAKHPDLQAKAAQKVASGAAQSVDDIEMLADMMKETAYKTTDDTLLFPAEVTEALVDERLTILKNVKRRLKADKSAFGAIVRNARKYEEVGNILEKNKNLAMKEKSALIEGIISKRATQKGPWSDYLTELAEKYKQNPTKRALEDLTDEYIRFIETADWESGKLPGGIGGAPGTGGPKTPKAGPAGFIDFKDQKGFLSLEPARRFLDRFRGDKKAQAKELVKYHVKAPKYYPHLFDKPSDLKAFWRGDDLPTKPHKGKLPQAKFRGGAGGYSTNPVRATETMALRMKAVLKEKAIYDRMMEWVVKDEKGVPKLLEYGDRIPEGYTAFFPEGRLRREMAVQKIFEKMREIEWKGADELLDAFWEGIGEVFLDGETAAGFLKGGDKVYLLPDIVVKRVKGHMKPWKSLGEHDAFYKNYRQLWVDSVLTGMFTTRWQKNNFIGGALMSIMDGSVFYIPEALRWKMVKELQDLIPPESAGGGLMGSLKGGKPWRAYEDTTRSKYISKPRKQLADTFYEINNIVDDLFRLAAHIKRMQLYIRKQMIKNGYKKTGTLVLDSIEGLSVDDLAKILEDIQTADPRLAEKIALDVSRNVYDFALKSPRMKWTSTYLAPFAAWWKFVNSWALSMAAHNPMKVALMHKIGLISTDVKRYEFDSLGLTSKGKPIRWDDLPDYMKYWTPVHYDKENEIIRWQYDYGMNPFNDLLDVKQLASGGPLPSWLMESTFRFDTFTGEKITGPHAEAWSGDVPDFAKIDDAINYGLSRTWALFTDVMPYGNIPQLIYQVMRPAAEYATAHPLGKSQPYKDSKGNVRYPYHGNPWEKLWKLMGKSYKPMSLKDLRKKVERKKSGKKQVKKRVYDAR